MLYTPSFSLDLFQIYTKCSSGHDLDPSSFLQHIKWHLWPPGGQFCFFLVSTPQSRVFSQSSSNSHQIILGPRSRLQSMFITHYICGHQGANFFCEVYRAEFSTNFLQIHTKYSLNQELDSIFVTHQSHLWPPRGPTLFFLFVLYTPLFSMEWMDLFQIHTKCALGNGQMFLNSPINLASTQWV